LNRHAETGGDILIAHLLIGQRLEGVELIGGMHGLADFERYIATAFGHEALQVGIRRMLARLAPDVHGHVAGAQRGSRGRQAVGHGLSIAR
jgi:hypothetical protein